MAYITYEQYQALYGTPLVSGPEFQMYATAASDIIDSITQYRIVEGGLSRPPCAGADAGAKGCCCPGAVPYPERP